MVERILEHRSWAMRISTADTGLKGLRSTLAAMKRRSRACTSWADKAVALA
jgi:hypothetical protein